MTRVATHHERRSSLPMWSRRVSIADWLVILMTAALAALTLYAASYPVVDTGVFYLLMTVWPLVGMLWSITLIGPARDPVATGAALALLAGFVASIGLLGLSLVIVVLAGMIGVAFAVVVALALFGVVVGSAQHRRLGWVVAPVLVLVTLAVMLSGLPRHARMWLAEPALTAYAQEVQRGTAAQVPEYADDGIVVGSIPILEVYEEGPAVHFVTAYVGVLADDGAGLAYAPSGMPEAGRGLLGWSPRYEHLLGPWYRWYPY